MTRYRQTFSEALAKVKELGEAKYRYDGKVVFISKAEFKKINKDYKNATPGQERMVVLDPKTQATVSAPVKFEEVELTEGDHEISMARGELEAIADKALKLSSMLQGKTDDAQLEAWVQSKITKAKDYMNTVSDYMTYNPDDAMESVEESFSDAQIKQLKKEYEPLRGKKISVDNANKLGAMFTKFDKDKNALEKLYGGDIPFVSTMAMTRLMTKHNYTASKIKAIRKEEVESLEEANIILEGQGTIKGFANDKQKDNMISLAKQHGLKVTDIAGGVQLSGNMRKILDMQLAAQRNGLKAEENDVEEGMMSKIDQMQKDGKSTAEIAKALKMDVKVVKGILGEAKDDAYAIGMAAAKKKYNDEPPLDKKTITKGHEIAKSILKKEETIVEFTSQQIKMAYGIANDKRYKGGNYTGAVKAIEKIAKGLSNHPDVKKVLQRTNEEKEHPAKMKYEQIAGLKKKAEKSGMPYGILKKVYDRGMAAWRGGHRPGTTQQQWAFARVNSFITKSSGTWGGADKDLAAKVKGE